MDEVVLELVFSDFFPAFPLLIISPLIPAHLSPPPEMCDSFDQAVYYHILSFKSNASSLTYTWLATE